MKSHIKVREPSEQLRRGNRVGAKSDSLLSEFAHDNITVVDIECLIPFPGQARINFDDDKIKELADSINEHGLRQPLTVLSSISEENKFEVVSGERRLRALKYLRYTKVPCIIINSKEKAEEIAIIENILRVDLHPIELGKAYGRLESLGYTQQKVADKFHVPRTQVVEYIKFSGLPFDIADQLIANKIVKRSILRKISSIEDIKEQESCLLSILSNDVINGTTNNSSLVKINYNWGKLEVSKKNVTNYFYVITDLITTIICIF